MKRFIYDIRSLLDCVKYYYRARKGRNVMITIFRGFDTDAQAKEYFKALDKMEETLSFPIINKKQG